MTARGLYNSSYTDFNNKFPFPGGSFQTHKVTVNSYDLFTFKDSDSDCDPDSDPSPVFGLKSESHNAVISFAVRIRIGICIQIRQCK